MRKYNILCVDDDEDGLESMMESLAFSGEIAIFAASSASSALKTIQNSQIDLVITDIEMPKMDGYELAKRLKSDPATENVPIIFITAFFKGSEFEKIGFDLGAIDYFEKPLAAYRLRHRVKLYMQIFQKEQEIKRINNCLQDEVEQKTRDIIKLNHCYELAQSIAMIGHYEMDEDGEFTYFSEELMNIFEVESTRVDGDFILDRLEEESRKQFELYNDLLVKRDKHYNIQLKIVTAGGNVKYILNSALAVNDKDKYFIGTIQDITQTVRLEHTVLDKSADIVNLNHELIFVSQSLEDEIKLRYADDTQERPAGQDQAETVKYSQQRQLLKRVREKLLLQQKALVEQHKLLNRNLK